MKSLARKLVLSAVVFGFASVLAPTVQAARTGGTTIPIIITPKPVVSLH